MSSDFAHTPALVELLRECIETFDDLEIVLALMRRAQRSATTEELSSELRIANVDLLPAVTRLERAGLVRSSPPMVRLDPHDPRRLIGLQELQTEYETNRTRVMSLLTENALHRVRTSAVRAFARAFVLRKKDDG